MTDTQASITAESLPHTPSSATTDDSRMKLYKERERDFLEFMSDAKRPTETDNELDDQPLSGLQCLLALTEILERAAQLRLSNFDLEQQIEVLQRLKQIAEVQSDLRSATLDLNANGIVRGKKTKTIEDVDGGRLKRTLSAESLNTFHTPIGKFDHSIDDFNKHRATHGKGSKLSETWGKVKDKLAPKEATHTSLSSKPSRRARSSTDQSGLLRHSLNAEVPTPTHPPGSGQFTQREINISPPTTDDFGGVWLGDDTGEGVAYTSDFGGVWLGPASAPLPSPEVPLVVEVSKTDCSRLPAKEELGRQSSDPVPRRAAHRSTANMTWSRVRSISNDESRDWVARTMPKNNRSSSPLRKKSSKPKLLALLPGSEHKRVKKGEQDNELPKDFRKKIEEWHTMREAGSTPAAGEVSGAAKTGKAAKVKNHKFRNKKKGGLLKHRSKSVEAMEDNLAVQQYSEDFEEKLREWSVKQGYHPTYYSEIRDSKGSSDNISEVSRESHSGPGDKTERVRLADGDYSLILNNPMYSCTDSNSSLSPSATVYFHSAENLQTLYEISQSADIVFHRETPANAQASRQLSKSEEAINSTVTTTLLIPQIEQSASATSSHVDLYARASDHSLEKHLSLFHVTSEASIHNDPELGSSDSLDHSEASPDTHNVTSTTSPTNFDLEPLPKIKVDDHLCPSTTSDINHTDGHQQGIEHLSHNGHIQADQEQSCNASSVTNGDSYQSGSLCSTEEITETQSEEEKDSHFEVGTSTPVLTTPAGLLSQCDQSKSVADSTSDAHNLKENESVLQHSQDVVNSDSMGGPPLTSEEKSDHNSVTINQPPTVHNHSYDINSNVTASTVDEGKALKTDSKTPSTATSVLHVGTDVPLKLRLKSLALEYESGESNRQNSTTTPYIKHAEDNHKRTRSYDIFSSPNVQSTVHPLYTGNNNVQVSTNHKLSSAPKPPVSYSVKSNTEQSSALVNNRFNNITKPHHSNIHRLKSADELIYEQSTHSNGKHYTRQLTVGTHLPSLDRCHRREMHEKPKEGTVKKALSMFLDGGTFNAQFGTDFARPTRSQPT